MTFYTKKIGLSRQGNDQRGRRAGDTRSVISSLEALDAVRGHSAIEDQVSGTTHYLETQVSRLYCELQLH